MPKITEMYAFIVCDKDENDEGIIGKRINGSWFPFTVANLSLMEKLKPEAQEMANSLNRQIHIVKFTVREEIETINPE